LERRIANPGSETTADALRAGRFANPGSETTADASLAGRIVKWLGI
jgi:hypothetical protein